MTATQILEQDYIEQAVARASKELADDIDFDLMASLYKQMGWTEVTFNPMQPAQTAYNIKEWLDKNCHGLRLSRNTRFLFEREKDAMLFMLRWAS